MTRETGSLGPSKIRADQAVLEAGLAGDLKEAQALILSGKIVVDDQRVDKVGILVSREAVVRRKGGDSSPYVSRAGGKLASAIQAFGLAEKFAGAVVLDVGASTGGFTDCALQHGAKIVVALDVGTNQLHWSLRQDPRVVSLEQTHIEGYQASEVFDWIVVDVSFISLARLVPSLCAVSKQGHSQFLLMVKPQFELAREEVEQGGVVRSEVLRQKAVGLVVAALAKQGAEVLGQCDSEVKGRRGNQEVFLWARV